LGVQGLETTTADFTAVLSSCYQQEPRRGVRGSIPQHARITSEIFTLVLSPRSVDSADPPRSARAPRRGAPGAVSGVVPGTPVPPTGLGQSAASIANARRPMLRAGARDPKRAAGSRRCPVCSQALTLERRRSRRPMHRCSARPRDGEAAFPPGAVARRPRRPLTHSKLRGLSPPARGV
jgi:hypothetical protein